MPTNPPSGYTSLTPFIVVTDGHAAIRFYEEVFAAAVISCMEAPDGSVAHAELDFGHGRLQLGDANLQFGLVAPSDADATAHSLALYCADVDDVVTRAVAAGATLREPVQTFVTGDRFGSLRDPFGQRWSVMTRVEDVAADEVQRRLAEWSASNL